MPEDKPSVPSDGITAVPSSAPSTSQSILNPVRTAVAAAPPPVRSHTSGPGPGDMKDGTREVIETIVFVVVLVLILKTFLAEAFVIPTGSMATTLLGYHRSVTCEACGYHFLVNASSEAEGEDRVRKVVTKCYCDNCRYLNVLRVPLPPGEMP